MIRRTLPIIAWDRFATYRAGCNPTATGKEKYSKIPAPWRRDFARWRKEV